MALRPGMEKRARGISKEVFRGFDRFKDTNFRDKVNRGLKKDIQRVLEEEITGIYRKKESNMLNFKVLAEDISNHFTSNSQTYGKMKDEARRLVGAGSTKALSENQLKEIANMEKRVWRSKLEAVDDAIVSFRRVLENKEAEIHRIQETVKQKLGELTKGEMAYKLALDDLVPDKVRNLRTVMGELEKTPLTSHYFLNHLIQLSLYLKEIELAEEVIKEKGNVPEI